jgi:NAD(P)-dependent dehydrogenase (short-subunit alcohol dehydrogenase family)
MRLEGKTALITGASRNIARQIALTFAREGADLVLNTRKSRHELEQLQSECRQFGVQTHAVLADVSDPDHVTTMVREGLDAFGKIDILVTCVAIRPHRPILEVTNEEWHEVMRTNLYPAFYLIKAVLPGMMQRRCGSIIALGGQAAITGRPNRAAVTTAKTGLLGLIRAVAAEVAPYNIRANLVNPGSTGTTREHSEWYQEDASPSDGDAKKLKTIPLERRGTVEDIANACLFYASDESTYITGDRMNVVGGRYIV